MANSLIIPPYRAALLTNADGSPVVRNGANGDGDPIATERQWYMFWQEMAKQVNDGSGLLAGLAGIVDYGSHAERPDPQFITDGALYVEWDRGSVLYQNQGGIWQYIAGTMYGTLAPDQRPTDLGPAADVGFQFRTSTDPARAFAWSGTAWIETTPIRYGTHAERLAATIANLVSGMLWMETDRGSVIYQNQGGTWLFLTGTMWGTLVPDQRPTDLGVHDAGFDFRSTAPPPREFIWNQTAWVEVTNISGATGLTHANVVTKVGAAGQIVEGGITDESAANSDNVHVNAAGDVGIGNPGTAPFPGGGFKHLTVGAIASALQPAINLATSTTGAIGHTINFANYGLASSDKRFAMILCTTPGTAQTGDFSVYTWNAGVFGQRLFISADGKVGIGNGNPLSRLSVVGLPTSAAGLASGDVWRDAAAGNVLKIVP
jgi:hypothetical protein